MSLTAFQEKVSPKVVSVLIYLLLTLGIGSAILVMCDGHMIYAMDDPYIALAHSEGIAHGTYGINPGETTSPSSSVIWAFLMLVGVGTSWHPLMPLFLNVPCGALTVWFLALIVKSCPWEPALLPGLRRQELCA